MSIIRRAFVLSLGVFVLQASAALAAVIAPTSAMGTAPLFGKPTLLIDGSGLLGVGPILTQTHQSIHTLGWLIDNTNPANELVFDFGGAPDLTDVYIWQYDQGACCTGRGVNTFDISFSTNDGASYGAPISLSLDSAAVNPGDERAQKRSFPLQTGVTNVKFTNMTDFPALPKPGWQGLNEVRFEDTGDPVPPFMPPTGSIRIGNNLTARDTASDGDTRIFFTNYQPMPDDGSVDSVGIHFQGSNSTFELHQLRPTGNPDEYSVVYSSGTITPFGFLDEVSDFPLPNGPTDVQAGDIFGHYGRGIPFSDAGGTNADNDPPIFFEVEAANAPQVGDLLTLSETTGASDRGPFPVSTGLRRDYAMAVNFQAVIPEPSTFMLAALGLLGLLGWGRRPKR